MGLDDDAITNVWIGSRTGLLKSVDLRKKVATNHYEDKSYGKENEIMCMCWRSSTKTDMLTGHSNGIVRNFSVNSGTFDGKSVCAPNISVGEKGTLCATCVIDNSIITASTKGNFSIWKQENIQNQVNVTTGDNLSCLKSNGTDLVACGGKENPLKIYDINNPDEPIFKSKNVKHDWLQLRVPIWVTGVHFIPDSSKVLTVTGTHNIRLYDPKSNAKRPVLETRFGEYPIISSTMVSRKSHQVIVGNTHGDCAAFDVRHFKHMCKIHRKVFTCFT